jgi:uncharacterized membrane protein
MKFSEYTVILFVLLSICSAGTGIVFGSFGNYYKNFPKLNIDEFKISNIFEFIYEFIMYHSAGNIIKYLHNYNFELIQLILIFISEFIFIIIFSIFLIFSEKWLKKTSEESNINDITLGDYSLFLI